MKVDSERRLLIIGAEFLSEVDPLVVTEPAGKAQKILAWVLARGVLCVFCVDATRVP